MIPEPSDDGHTRASCQPRFNNLLNFKGAPQIDTDAAGRQSIDGIVIYDPAVLMGFSEGVGGDSPFAISNNAPPGLRPEIVTTGYLHVVGEMPKPEYSATTVLPMSDAPCRYEAIVSESTPGAFLCTDGLGGQVWRTLLTDAPPFELPDSVTLTGTATTTSFDPELYKLYTDTQSRITLSVDVDQYGLRKDRSDVWYIVPTDKFDDFQFWADLDEDFIQSLGIPAYAKRVDDLQSLTFGFWNTPQ